MEPDNPKKNRPKMASTEFLHQNLNIKWNDHPSIIQTALSNDLIIGQFVDVTLACSGKTIKCHRLILSACSTYFVQMFKENPSKDLIVFLRDIKAWELDALVTFMYNGNVTVTRDQVSDLIKAAEYLKITGLHPQQFESANSDQKDVKSTASEQRVQSRLKGIKRQQSIPYSKTAKSGLQLPISPEPAQARQILAQPAKRKASEFPNPEKIQKRWSPIPTQPKLMPNNIDSELQRAAMSLGLRRLELENVTYPDNNMASSPPSFLRNLLSAPGAKLSNETEVSLQNDKTAQEFEKDEVEHIFGNFFSDFLQKVQEEDMIGPSLEVLEDSKLCYSMPPEAAEACLSADILSNPSQHQSDSSFLVPALPAVSAVPSKSAKSNSAEEVVNRKLVEEKCRLERLQKAMELTMDGTNVRQAAMHFDVPRTTLCNYMKRQGMPTPKRNPNSNSKLRLNGSVLPQKLDSLDQLIEHKHASPIRSLPSENKHWNLNIKDIL